MMRLAFILGAILASFMTHRADAKDPKFHEPNLCGPIAHYAVCFSQGIDTTIGELTELSGYDGFGVTIAGLVHASQKKGLAGKAYASSFRHLRRLSGPAIVDYPRGHFCVVAGVRKEGVVLFDPPEGTRLIDPKDFSADWGGHVIAFEQAERP